MLATWITGLPWRLSSDMANDHVPVDILGYRYIINPPHRNGAPAKSQWTVSVEAEHACFELGVSHGWISVAGDSAWGLHLVDGLPENLGKTAPEHEPEGDLFIAYFQLAAVCHGYPSDFRRSKRETPPVAVTRDWLTGRYLRPSVVRKLQQGQPCGL
jgi:hypothetical protein